MVDPITLLIATGLRWLDFDAAAGTVAVTGKVVRQSGKGLHRIDETKTAASRRKIPLPSFAVAMLTERGKLPFLGEQSVIFPSSSGTLRDLDNFAGQWRAAPTNSGCPM